MPYFFIRMLIAFVAVLSCVTLYALPVNATTTDSSECPKAPATEIIIDTVFDDTQIITTESMLRIKARAEVSNENGHKERWPIGLSVGMLMVKLDSQIQTLKNSRDSSLCSHIKSLHVLLGFTDNRIYVARDLPRRSCPYREVLEHEERHKTVDRDLTSEMAEEAKGYFASLADKIGTIYQKSPVSVDSVFDEKLNAAMKDFSKKMNEERAQRQANVDTEEEYTRIGKSCDGQLAEIVNQRLSLIQQTEPDNSADAAQDDGQISGMTSTKNASQSGDRPAPETADDANTAEDENADSGNPPSANATTYGVH